MSDQDDSPNDVDLDAAEQATESGVEAGAQNDSEGPDVSTIIAALQAENADMKDRVLRAVAEMENLRKRTQREVSDARTYAIAEFARDMLSATDNLERALQVLPEETKQGADADVKALIEGIEMTEREMQRLLQKNGVKPILANGEKFNPHKHQAMFEVPDPTVPEGTVVQVMQSGFEIGERVLRPAMVGVAKGGPKAAKPSAANTNDESSDNSVSDEAEHIDKQV